jgi:hypothetical protein
MRKIVVALGMSLLLLAAGCEQEEPTEPTPEESPSPTPEVMGTFQLQGRVVEALASVAATPGPGTTPTPAATPTPQATPTGSPAATPPATPTVQATPTPTATPGAGAIEDGAPGSLSIRLTAFSGSDTTCSFQAGDTVVVAFTRATQYTPADLGTDDRFPRNLRETNVSVQGTVADEETCVLVAESVSTQAPGTPTPGAAGASPTPTATPSPTGTPSPRATPSPSPTE